VIIKDDFVAAELFFKPNCFSHPSDQSIGQYWKEIICNPVIPFDLSKRSSKLTK
jgi:hypothetical protein